MSEIDSPAVTASPADPDITAARAGRYEVEPSHTRVLFGVSHFGFTTFYGEFTGASGTLDFVPGQLEQSLLSVSVPVVNVQTTNRILDDELRSADWLDAERFPTIALRSTAVRQVKKGAFAVTGSLSLHGITREIGLEGVYVGGGINPKNRAYTIGFDIRGHIRRSDFGVTTALPLIGDSLELIISGAFEHRPAPR